MTIEHHWYWQLVQETESSTETFYKVAGSFSNHQTGNRNFVQDSYPGKLRSVREVVRLHRIEEHNGIMHSAQQRGWGFAFMILALSPIKIINGIRCLPPKKTAGCLD